MRHYNDSLKTNSRNLRKSATFAEVRLWSKLRNRQFMDIKFRRQFIIDNFILDFYCPKYKLCIELDGFSHDEDKYDYDIKRQKYIESLGINVLRFTESEVMRNMDNVLQTIENFVNESHPHP